MVANDHIAKAQDLLDRAEVSTSGPATATMIFAALAHAGVAMALTLQDLNRNGDD